MDIYGYNISTLELLTENDILDIINNNTLYDPFIDLDDILGGIKRDSNNKIISAALIRGEYRLSAAAIDIDNNLVDPSRESWENLVINEINFDTDFNDDTKVLAYGNVAFSNEFGAAIGGDGMLYSIGCMLLIIYTAIALGKRDYVHSMIGLAFAAIITVGLSVIGSHGFAGYLGLIYTPFSSTLPFLILGMFIVAHFIVVHFITATIYILIYRSWS